MKYFKEYALPFLIIIFSLCIFFIFRSIPVTKIWNGYSIAYIPIDSDKNVVNKTFEQSGCKNIISFDNQYIPLLMPHNTPEVSLALSGLESTKYLQNRNSYFFDKNNLYQLYYIPDEFVKNAEIAINSLNSHNIMAIINIASTYPFIVPIICLIFASILTYYSDKKILCISFLFLPIYFSFMMPFYSIAVALCVFMYIIYLSIKVWKRNKALQYLSKDLLIVSFTIIIMFAMITTGIKYFILFFLLFIAEYFLFYFIKNINNFFEMKYPFKVVKIIPARMISLKTKKTKFCLLICSASIFILLISSIFATKINISSSNKSIQIPGPHGVSGNIPTIDDYIDWKWNTMTFPYISLNDNRKQSKPQLGDKVVFSSYSDSDNEKINETKKSIVFDSNFIQDSLNSIDKLQYPAIEKMLKLQKNVSVGYISTGSQNISIFTVIFLILSFCISTFFYITNFRGVK